MMTTGFVALPRSIMSLPLWKKPNYYIKVFLYLLLNASFIDTDFLKRGELIVDLEELAFICSSGTGSSAERHTARCVSRAIHYLCSEASGVHIGCKSVAKGKMLVSLLDYDKITNSKAVGGTVGGTTGDERGKTTIIYNNNNNNNKPVISRPASVLKAKPTAFSNFEARQKDFEAIKQKAKEKLKQLR